MRLPINTDGTVLPVSQDLVAILSDELSQSRPEPDSWLGAEAITFVFRDPDYSADLGGYHPVEIRLELRDGEYEIQYLTDFSYVGSGFEAELTKELDFDFAQNLFSMRYCPDSALSEGAELFNSYQINFVSYYQMGVYKVSIIVGEAYET